VGHQHVVRRYEGWAVVGEGNPPPIAVTRTQGEAIALARRRAQHDGADVIVHSRQGELREHTATGHDQQDPEGPPY
jgi:hypothetical protein